MGLNKIKLPKMAQKTSTSQDAIDIDLTVADGEVTAATSSATASKDGLVDIEVRKTVQRARQIVVPVADRLKVVRFLMSLREGGELESGDLSRGVREFPLIFPARNAGKRKSSLMKVSRWWKMRTSLIEEGASTQLTRRSSSGTTKVLKKVRSFSGRGRRIQPWVLALECDIYSEFRRLRAAGLKMTTRTLLGIARELLKNGKEEVYASEMVVGKDADDNTTTMASKVHLGFIERFAARHNVVVRRQAGKLMTSPDKQILKE